MNRFVHFLDAARGCAGFRVPTAGFRIIKALYLFTHNSFGSQKIPFREKPLGIRFALQCCHTQDFVRGFHICGGTDGRNYPV